MTSPSKPDLHSILLGEFTSVCATLQSLALLPKKQRTKAAEAHACLEASGLALMKTGLKEKEAQRATWMDRAAASLNPNLVRAFGPAPANTISFQPGAFPWRMVAASATPEHLEAMYAAGCNMQPGHDDLLERAMKARGTEVHSFLEQNIETVWGKTFNINKLRTADLARHADFVARYLQAAKTHHPESLQWWIEIAMRTLDGRDSLILHCIGVSPRPGHFVPDAMQDAFSRQSAHYRLNIEKWKKDPADLLRNSQVLDAAVNDLIRA